ncbi:N-formylglutamate amidohydrolase [Planctomycetes bacterium Pan216]|uniref:N-formylglutamate amidohydrolase n=1 Tax=Kolteria novifilia TaxID=2527975 RepID=A0A518B6W9_9BACT|nr:N-formylglutamate amidohydrolase [Planctomycetes bacterium Pan216]
MEQASWAIVSSDGPLVAASIHSGHSVRRDVVAYLAVSEDDRLREEDPFTDQWTLIAPSRINVFKSRFEFDLNRPRERCIYLTPDDAWGLRVWNRRPSAEVIEGTLALYDAFYVDLEQLLGTLLSKHRRVVVYDLHTYNHRRLGPGRAVADPRQNPDVNLGTGTMDRGRWSRVVDRFLSRMSDVGIEGRRLDVRENVKFRGGHFPRWIHDTFPDSVCVLSIEFKKFFMDEWTGQPDNEALDAITQALGATTEAVLEELARS